MSTIMTCVRGVRAFAPTHSRRSFLGRDSEAMDTRKNARIPPHVAPSISRDVESVIRIIFRSSSQHRSKGAGCPSLKGIAHLIVDQAQIIQVT